MRRATGAGVGLYLVTEISIHALLAESDCFTIIDVKERGNFYPRSPCGERRGLVITAGSITYFYPRSPCGERRDWFFTGTLDPKFLSTLSLRRATLMLVQSFGDNRHFYPRSPCGERLAIHVKSREYATFLSTLSLRRATV